MRVRRLFSTSLSLVVLVTQLAMPISQALTPPPSAPPGPVGPDSQPPPSREQIVIPVTDGATSTVAKPPDDVPPVTTAPPPAPTAPRAVRSVPLGVGNSNYGQTQRDTDNPQNHPGHHFAGSVNVLNGNFFLTVGDFFIPGRGLSLQLARSYNSLRAANDEPVGAFGPGWTHSYETQVISETGGLTLTVQQADGALHDYTDPVPCFDNPLEDTCYQPPPGLYRQLRVLLDGRYMLIYKNGTWQEFDALGRLSGIHDRHGNTVVLLYDICGSFTEETLCQVFDPTFPAVERYLQFTYEDGPLGPHITEISEVVPGGRTITYGYDANGRLVDVAYPERMTTSTLTYEYDDWNRMIAYDDIRQPAGVRHADEIIYDTEDRAITVTYDSFFDVFMALDYAPSGDYISDPAQNPVGAVELTDGEGQITRVEYDTHGNITYEGDWFPEFGWWWGKWWWWYPVEWWLLERKMDANGNPTEYVYDAWGNTTLITNALGAAQRFLWEFPYYENFVTYGNVLSATNSLNVTTLYEYDYAAPDGWVMTEVQAAGTADESATVYVHDEQGQLLSQTDNAGQVTTYDYDEFGNVTFITDARGYLSHNDYDMLGRPISTTTPAGQVTAYEYDEADRLISVTDAEGGTTHYTYSGDGRDNLVQLVNANGVTTNYQYDNLDRLIQQTDSLSQTTTYQYDAVGRLIERNDADGLRTTYTYNAKSRMTQAEYYAADAIEPYQTNTYEYDGAGNLIRMANAEVRMEFQYDRINQRTQIDMWVPSWPNTRTLQLVREPEAGNLTEVTGPGGYDVQYTYDSLNRVTSVTDPAEKTTTFWYDEAGRLRHTNYPDGSVSDYAYNPTNHLTDIHHQVSDTLPYSYTYTYDGQGNIIGEIDRGEVYSYTYDSVDRLIASEGGEQGEVTFEYDAVGNRLSANTPVSETQYTYDAHNRLLQASDASFAYNNMGARTQAQFNTGATRSSAMASSQSDLGALALAQSAQSAQSSETVTYTYDNDMRLTQVGPDTRLLYDPLGNLIGVVDNTGQARYYLRDGEDVYLELNENGDVLAQYVLDGEGVLSMWREGRWHMFLYDGRGRVRHVIDPVTGELITHYGTHLNALSGYPYFYNPIRMRGAWWLPELGLIHFGEGVFWDSWFGTYLVKAWPWLYWPFGPFHPWRPVFRFWPWPWPWARPWGWPWPQPWPFLWPWPGAWVRPWVIWPFWPWGLRPWWPWWYWRAWWGWHWWGHWWCWHPWWWFCKWWWWPWWHPWWWWGYWWWPWWWWSSCWWWPSYWWWWPRWWWPWWGGRFWWCWWWWWPWPGWTWWPWRWPPTLGPPEVGDAPDRPYDSYRRNQGAMHGIWWYEWLGAGRDGEWDSRQVDADRYDDGVALDPYNSTLIFTPTVSSPWSARYSAWNPVNVHGWADWNSDGDWDDANEWIINWSGYPGGGAWPAGQSSLGIIQPFNSANVQFGAGDLAQVWLRFRLNYADTQPASPRGYSRFGEVEDHVLTIVRPVKPSWDGRLDLPPDYAPLTVSYPRSVQGINISIAPTVAITPTWSDGPDHGDQVTIAHAPFTVGQRYTITLSNGALHTDTGMALTDQFSFEVVAIKPTTVTVNGPAAGVVNNAYTFTATVLPVTTTLPLTYTWQTTGPSRTLTDTCAGQTSVVSFTWSISGMQHITVAARNAAGQAIGYDTIDIHPQTFKPTSVTVTGPSTGVVSNTYTFTATTLPGTASLPLTYIWQTTGPSRTLTDTNAGQMSVVSFTWFISGMQHITVTARNVSGAAVGYHTIDIKPSAVIWHYVYLPLTLKGP